VDAPRQEQGCQPVRESLKSRFRREGAGPDARRRAS
jgi:hypothetical protein